MKVALEPIISQVSEQSLNWIYGSYGRSALGNLEVCSFCSFEVSIMKGKWEREISPIAEPIARGTW
jgi:hypothetical protein